MGDPIELTELNLRISAEYRHHHSDLVLARYPEIESEVRSLVSGTHAVVASSRTRSGVSREGLTATSLNESLKGAFVEAGRWGFEATVEDGIIFDSTSLATSREGFDLARYDISSNLAGLWSLCFGRRPVSDGRSVWDRETGRRSQWTNAARVTMEQGIPGQDLVLARTSPTIFGDVQFGNWALAYRDLMRLLDADVQIDVDLFVYVTGDTGLTDLLSDGIVTFGGSVAILQRFSKLVKVPIWVLGLSRN